MEGSFTMFVTPAVFLRQILPTTLLLSLCFSAGCRSWLSNVSTRDLPKFYVQEQAIFIRTEWDGVPANESDIKAFQDTIARYNSAGFFMRTIPGTRPTGTDNALPIPDAQLYLFAEPVLTIAITNPTVLTPTGGNAAPVPAAAAGSPLGATGTSPAFFLREMLIKWEVPGFSFPEEQKIALNTTLRANTYQLPRIPVTYPGQVIREIQQAKGVTKGIRGTMTIQILARDLDPLLSEQDRDFRVTHPLPVFFTTGNILLAEAIANQSPLPNTAPPGGVSAQGTSTPMPSAVPSVSASVSPTPGATATATTAP